MTLADRLHTLRTDLGLTQDAFGAQGFISAPGWIKIENGQRLPSEKLINSLVNWLVGEKYLMAKAANGLRDELLTLKYLGSSSTFVRGLARAQAEKLPNGFAILAEDAGVYKVKRRRGRPPKVKK